MKYDAIILGGGLSGLVTGIALCRAGHSTAIISSGQSALHFNSGSYGLLGHVDGKEVSDPSAAIASREAPHPYARIGAANLEALIAEAKQIFADAGITLEGSDTANHHRLTPVGEVKPAWLSAAGSPVMEKISEVAKNGPVLIASIKGYLDFYPAFLANGLKREGIETKTASVTIPALEHLRTNPTEFRAPGIARLLTGQALADFAAELRKAAGDASAVIMPAVIGMRDEKPLAELERLTGKKIFYVPTTPMSVTGMRQQAMLRRYFEHLGGVYMLGDKVTEGRIADESLKSLSTVSLGADSLTADQFVMATGSFFSSGLVARPDSIRESVFDLDVDAPADRSKWYSKQVFDVQPYMSFGVHTDDSFRVSKGGKTIANLYAVGAILGGCNSLKEESGAGVAVLTALTVAREIDKKLSGHKN